MKGKRILVIDDDKSVRVSFKMALEDRQLYIDTAESGEIGIEMMTARKYDLVFLDLQMPGMNGIQALRELKKIDDKVTVFIVTAFHREFLSRLKVAEEDGIEFEIVNKPLRSEMINLIVDSVLIGPQLLTASEGD